MSAKSFRALLKREIFLLALNPASFVSGLFFILFCFTNFFILRRFFVPSLGSTDMRFFFSSMPLIWILCVPALTIHAWHSYDFYAVIPASSFTKVFAKWLAAFAFFSFFVLTSAAVPLAASFFGTVDFSVVLTGFICLFFALGTVIAAGQFISLAVRSKALSFFLSALLFSAASFINNTASVFSFSGLQTLLRFLSFSRHFDAAGKGILDSRDLLFYLCVTLFFLSLSAYTLEKTAYSSLCKNSYKKAAVLKYRAVFLLCFLGLWNSRIFYFRADVTSKRIYSLSEASKTVLSVLKNRLTISYYVSPELENIYPGIRDLKEFLYNYADLSSDIAVRIVRVKKDDEKAAAQAAGIFPQILENPSSALKEGNPYTGAGSQDALSVYSGLVLEYGEKRITIPFVLTHFDTEFAIADMIPLITGNIFPNSVNTRRSVGILLANGLNLETDYPYLVNWLKGAGFAVRIIEAFMLDSADTPLLPQSEPLLLIGSSGLTEAQCEILDTFLTEGGALLCAVSSHEADLNTWKLKSLTEQPFFSLLNKQGVFMQEALIGDLSCARIRMLRQNGSGKQRQTEGVFEAYEDIDYPLFVHIEGENIEKNHPVTASFSGLDLFWPSYMHTNASVLAHTSSFSRALFPLKTDDKDYGKSYTTDPFSLSGLMQKENVFSSSRFQAGSSEPQFAAAEKAPAVCAVEGPYGFKMIVVPDQYFLSRMVEYTGAFYNFDFTVNALLWLSGEENLLSIKNRAFTDYRIKAANAAEFTQKVRITLICLFVWLCAVFAGFFILLRFYRKKHGYAAFALHIDGIEKPPFTPQNGLKRGKNA